MSKYFEKHKFYVTEKKLWIKLVYVALEDVLIHKSGIYVMPRFRNGGLLWKLSLSESGGRGGFQNGLSFSGRLWSFEVKLIKKHVFLKIWDLLKLTCLAKSKKCHLENIGVSYLTCEKGGLWERSKPNEEIYSPGLKKGGTFMRHISVCTCITKNKMLPDYKFKLPPFPMQLPFSKLYWSINL